MNVNKEAGTNFVGRIDLPAFAGEPPGSAMLTFDQVEANVMHLATDVNGVDLVGQMSLMRTLSIEGLSLTNVPLTFADTPVFAALGLADTPAISLGMQHLALFDRVAIDFANRRVMFDVPADVARAMRQSRNRGFRAPL